MNDSPRCPVCDVLHGPPRWPSVRTVAWSDDCACSDAGLCVAHQYGHDDRTPERPPAPELALRAEVEFERRRVEHTALLAKFAAYEALKKERDEARAELEAAREESGRYARALGSVEAVLGLAGDVPLISLADEARAALRDVAARQREACAVALHCPDADCECQSDTMAKARATPLVTEADK